MTVIVPRSGWSSTSNDTPPTIRKSGSIHRIGSASRESTFLERMAAVAATTTNFASSEGCTESGPTWSHRAAPPATVPAAGCRTSANNTTVTASNGAQALFQTR
jgi:hypothetical protein